MMGVYIKGMEMPKSLGVVVTIYPDGRVVDFNGSGPATIVGKAVPVPPHGRLGDLDALLKVIEQTYSEDSWWFESRVDEAPTIIPAEEE